MFSFLAFTGAFVSILFFCFMAASRFQDTALITAFFSILFSTIICFKLANMDHKVNDTEYEVTKLKSRLNIKDGDMVNNSDMQDGSTDDSEDGYLEDESEVEYFGNGVNYDDYDDDITQVDPTDDVTD